MKRLQIGLTMKLYETEIKEAKKNMYTKDVLSFLK